MASNHPTKRRRPAELKVEQILDGLQEAYPEAQCALDHVNPFQLLVATMLSAQCTDATVNKVTPVLFGRFMTPEQLARASQAELEQIIHSTGFFRNKAKNIKAASQKIIDEFGGQVPADMTALLSLPGVARKTANVVLGTAFGIPSGVVVDTHVFRISRRLGLTRSTTPERVEEDLIKSLPQKEWILFSHRVIHHGRQVCTARRPQCGKCILEPYCPKIDVEDVQR
ncbi:MAG: endonuclease III [Acidobacteriota bacterium]